MVKVLLHGCNGKIGRALTRLISQQDGIEVAAGVDKFLGTPNDYPVFASVAECNVDCDVVIDFSTATAVDALLNYCIDKKLPAVICTTGLSEETRTLLNKASNSTPIFFSANMSLGVNLITALAKRATEVLADSGFDIEIIEKHHNQKIDAPSGTALAIADAINDILNHEYEYKFDRSQVREKRPKKEIGIHAVRGGTIVGEHDVLFAGNDEFITISHQATSKEVFANGAIKAAKFLADKEPGLYNMDNLFAAL